MTDRAFLALCRRHVWGYRVVLHRRRPGKRFVRIVLLDDREEESRAVAYVDRLPDNALRLLATLVREEFGVLTNGAVRHDA